MKTYYWTTEEALATSELRMSDYLEHHNMLDIIFVEGTYAEGVNAQNKRYAIHASGNGDFLNHKVDFVELRGNE